MKIYALAEKMYNCISGDRNVRAAVTREARSIEEAVGVGIREAQRDFPYADGWRGHICVACEIPADWLPDAARIATLEAEISALHQRADDIHQRMDAVEAALLDEGMQ